jgi:Tol biopolymer transport system component
MGFFPTRRFLLTAALALPTAACGMSQSGSQGAGSAPAAAPAAPVALAVPGAPVLPGRLLYVADSDLWLLEGGKAHRVTGDRVTRQPVWSPDGKRIAHVKIHINSSELWVMDADGANARPLTENFSTAITRNNWAFRPAWWPDGSRLLFLSEETTNDLMLWQVGLDGRNRRQFLAVPDLEGGIDMPSVSSDAKRLLAVRYRTEGARSQVFSYALPNGPWRQLTEHPDGAYDPVWSPDGTRVAYTVRQRGRHDLWVMQADGSDARPLTDSGACRAPCWSPDGQQLAYLSGETGAFDVWTVPVPAAEAVATAGATAPTGARPTGGPAASSTVPVKLPAARQVTKGLNADAVSGLSWAK